MIGIISYGMGNAGSVAHALDFLDAKYVVSRNRKDLEASDALIFPGVGSFPAAMANLEKFGLLEELHRQVMVNHKPFFGICLGMQLLAKDSTEGGLHDGLGWIDGHVTGIERGGNLRLPHVGWNNVQIDQPSVLFERIEDPAHFYFDHSYHLECDRSLCIATTCYGKPLAAAIRRENIFATQFHPEKSQRNGLKMLRNFLNYVHTYNRC